MGTRTTLQQTLSLAHPLTHVCTNIRPHAQPHLHMHTHVYVMGTQHPPHTYTLAHPLTHTCTDMQTHTGTHVYVRDTETPHVTRALTHLLTHSHPLCIWPFTGAGAPPHVGSRPRWPAAPSTLPCTRAHMTHSHTTRRSLTDSSLLKSREAS